MDILIDYLTFTDKRHNIVYWINKLNIDNNSLIGGRGRYGWSGHLLSNGVHFYFDNREDVCIELSGKGCRFLESCNNLDFDWMSFLFDLSNNSDIHISRLDIACDDKESILDFSNLYDCVNNHKYICKAKRCIWVNGDEQEILFGSSQSDTRLRIYNKALERGVSEHWIRSEFQFRNDSVYSFIENLKLTNNIGLAYQGVLINYLRFTEFEPTNNNNVRVPTCDWWSIFTNYASRLKNITVGGLEYNLQDLDSYLRKQCASSCKLYLDLHGGDISSFLDLINNSNYNVKQQQLLNDFKRGVYDNL